MRSLPRQLPLRLRLTAWYLLSLGLLLVLFTSFLYWQVQRSLIAQVDAGLQLAANQALLRVVMLEGVPTFPATNQNPEVLGNLSDDFIIQLLDRDGRQVDLLNNDDHQPSFTVRADGSQTINDDGEPWRVYRQAIGDGRDGWIVVAQELDPVTATLAALRGQLLLGLPLLLLLAGLGAHFISSRALLPIDQMTRTAQAISAGDLGQRIHYEGPADEVGRLARTFDSMLDRLQAAFARERRFTGDAAHELRTPLTALKGQIGVTLNRDRTPEVYRETLQTLESQVDRLIRLSNDLLLMARLDQEQRGPDVQTIDELGDFLGAIIDQIRPLATAKQITVVEELPRGQSIAGDFDLLIRLFLNLLDNAVKYTPEGGTITIQATGDNAQVAITIADTGPGIATRHIPHLFNRFYRVEDDRGRNTNWSGVNGADPGGAGLGLSIAQEIARIHAGIITVSSKAGGGSTFTVQLPALARKM